MLAPRQLYLFGYNADLAGITTLLPNTWYFGAVTFDGTTVALNGHGGIDFSGSTSNYLAGAYTNAFGFTNCSIVMVGNHADQPVQVSISAPLITQEFLIYDKSLIHESAPNHWGSRGHQDAPTNHSGT